MEANEEPIESTLPEPAPEPEPAKSGMIREVSKDQTVSRRALVNAWQDKITRAKKHWESPLKRMREDMDFFMGKQWPWQNDNDDRYVANLVQRHVQQRVSGLYAKNPKAVAKRRNTLDFTLWEGEPGQIQAAQMANDLAMQTTGMPDPNSLALMDDVMKGMERRRQMDRIAKTLEIVFHHVIESQNFKTQMKQLVRRTCVTGVGFVKIGYHRMMGKRPEDVEKITDIGEEMKTLQRLMADKQDNIFDETSQKFEQLKLLQHELSEKADYIMDEGLVFDFPQSHSIIVDPRCRQLNGFIGAEWVAQEFILTVDEIKEIYNVDLGTNYTRQEDTNKKSDDDKNDSCLARIWEIYSKKDGMKYVIADGYNEFLQEPNFPEIDLKRFWPFFVLSFNEVENDKHIYAPSDVRLLMPIQKEYNLARQRLREHRNANRPLYVTPVGSLSESDIRKLMDRSPNEVIQLNSIQPGQKVGDILQPVQPIAIDPSLYDTSMLMEDIYRVIGAQEANMGGTGNSTATEVSVAESSRQTSNGSNVDDLDELLTEIARAAGQILLIMMDPQTATKIAGPGAVWPSLSSAEVASELLLEIECGSSGRPNKAAEIANFERLAPTLIQIPGIDPTWLAKEAIRRMDDGLDITDAIKSALPSIVAMNSQKQMAGGGPGGDPNQQGAQGGNNAPGGPEAAAGAPGGGQAPGAPMQQGVMPG
ncbi:hypothetical protein UFOVP543_34 [uncultured Caudovirales phage]|uniref:Portal protein n=1 Tax=uncultured Caudovirales phage TaxID=2100421 RepID=A0A6J5MXX3_9CAUD|nr:hypothetical protein UFOVP543_34 [uncultured Caudovirales phage]CAB4163346.1 hypothetical protein UFOVP804_10 [uncultured Caudovirales phage]